MKEIDRSLWPRREHFDFFRRSDLPFYNVNTPVDITGLPEFAKANAYSVNTTIMFVLLRAANRVENFRYRLRGETVVLHDSLHPSFTHMGAEDLFRLITLDFVDDLSGFDQEVRRAVETSRGYFDLEKLQGRDDFVFLSPLPWMAWTAVDHTLSLKKDDAIPRMSWGRFSRQADRLLLPFNVQVNHIFVDGIHVARFLEALEDEVRALTGGTSGG